MMLGISVGIFGWSSGLDAHAIPVSCGTQRQSGEHEQRRKVVAGNHWRIASLTGQNPAGPFHDHRFPRLTFVSPIFIGAETYV